MFYEEDVFDPLLRKCRIAVSKSRSGSGIRGTLLNNARKRWNGTGGNVPKGMNRVV